MKLFTTTVKEESKSCKSCLKDLFVKGQSNASIELRQPISNWIKMFPLDRPGESDSAILSKWMSAAKSAFIKFNIWYAPPLFEQKLETSLIWFSEFDQTLNCLSAHGNIVKSVKPLNNLIISISSTLLILPNAPSQLNVFLTFGGF